MTPEELQRKLPKAVRAAFDAIPKSDLGRTLACFTPDGSFRDPSGHWEGIDALGTFFTMGFGATKDVAWQLHDVAVDGNRVILEWTYAYTVTLGKAAGRRTQFDGLSIIRMKDGKIWRYRDYWDGSEVLAQLGAASWAELLESVG